MKKTQERCDHCQKWVKEGQPIYSLDEVIPKNINDGYAICERCIDSHKDPQYWTNWAERH